MTINETKRIEQSPLGRCGKTEKQKRKLMQEKRVKVYADQMAETESATRNLRDPTGKCGGAVCSTKPNEQVE
jgi:hypothetical protein